MKKTKLYKCVRDVLKKFDSNELNLLFFAGGRLWMDICNWNFGITYGYPDETDEHDMDDCPPTGQWVWAPIWPLYGDEPFYNGGCEDDNWPALVDDARRRLLSHAQDVAELLEIAAKQAYNDTFTSIPDGRIAVPHQRSQYPAMH